MKPRTFFKTFSLFMVALLVPLLLFCWITVSFTQLQVRRTSESSNTNYLYQIRNNTEMILSRINQLSLFYDLNTNVGYQLDLGLQRNGSSYTGNQVMGIIRSFSTAESISHPYVHSIYVYFDYSSNRYFSSTTGITSLGQQADQAWLDSYRAQKPGVSQWTEKRYIQQYLFETPIPVITIYRRTFSRPGVIVLNLLPQNIEKVLSSDNQLENMPYIAVINESGETVLQNGRRPFSDKVDLSDLRGAEEETFTRKLEDRDYVISRLSSNTYGWTYLAIVAQDSLYSLSAQISMVFLFVLLVCLLLGLALSIWFTSRNYRQMKNIMNLFEATEKGLPLPSLTTGYMQDEYALLTDNLIKTFVEQRYMKLALSEKIFHTKALELLALQSQINPHFLFNTLKTIYWKAFSLTDGPNDVSHMIEALTSILRYSLDDPQATVTLGEELAQTKNYLEIQAIRYKDRFTVEFQYDEILLDIRMLRLTLQPLVENSIQHGILLKDGKNRIRIHARRVKDLLSISIMDNGIGIKKEALEKLRMLLQSDTSPEQEMQHIGLINTAKRLYLKYGTDATIRIRSVYGLGTCVMLKLPIRTPQENRNTPGSARTHAAEDSRPLA